MKLQCALIQDILNVVGCRHIKSQVISNIMTQIKGQNVLQTCTAVKPQNSVTSHTAGFSHEDNAVDVANIKSTVYTQFDASGSISHD